MGIIEEIPRLSPVMVSRKNQVLAFIRAYWRTHDSGPSISEICAAVNCPRSRAQAAIRKLEMDGLVHRLPGVARSVRPAETHEHALQLLKAQGWTVNAGRLELVHPMPPLVDLDEDGRLVIRSGTNACLPAGIARAHGAEQDGDEQHADGDGRGDFGGA